MIEGAIKGQKALKRLRLNNDGLQSEAIKGLSALILSNYRDDESTHLTELEISHNLLEDAGYLVLIPLILRSPHLHTLKLGTTRVRNNKNAGEAMSKALLHLRHLRILNLNDNNLGQKAGENLSTLFSTILSSHSIIALNLSDIGVASSISLILTSLLTLQPDTLEFIDLSANELTSEHSTAIAQLFKRQKKLQYIKMEDNELKNRGIMKILKALTDHSDLRYVNFNNNYLTSTSIAALLSFASSHQLDELHLNR